MYGVIWRGEIRSRLIIDINTWHDHNNFMQTVMAKGLRLRKLIGKQFYSNINMQNFHGLHYAQQSTRSLTDTVMTFDCDHWKLAEAVTWVDGFPFFQGSANSSSMTVMGFFAYQCRIKILSCWVHSGNVWQFIWNQFNIHVLHPCTCCMKCSSGLDVDGCLLFNNEAIAKYKISSCIQTVWPILKPRFFKGDEASF